MLNKDPFLKFMHMAASVKEPRDVCKSLHSPTHRKLEVNYHSTVTTPKLANNTAMVIITLVTANGHKSHTDQVCNGHTVITLKIILIKIVGYDFCQVTLLFWPQQKVVPCTNYKI